MLHGGQISVAAGLLATMCALLVGLTLGTLAGFLGGVVDRVLMRTADIFMALPWIYLLFAVRAALPLRIDTRATFLMLVAVLGIVGWARPARMIRGIVLSARERTYVRAAEGFGAGAPYLLWRHILPHTYGLVLTQASVLIPQYLLAEVALSFLGLGIGEPTASWGGMLGTLQQYHVLTSYWWMLAPAVALGAVTLGYHALTTLVHERARVIAASVLLAVAIGVPSAGAATPPATPAAGEEVLVVSSACRPPRRAPRRRPSRRAQVAQPGLRRRRAVAGRHRPHVRRPHSHQPAHAGNRERAGEILEAARRTD